MHRVGALGVHSDTGALIDSMISFDKIVDNIFVGACPVSGDDVRCLKQAGLTAVLNLQSQEDFSKLEIDWPKMERYYREMEIAVYRFGILDYDDDDLLEKLPGAVDLLAEIISDKHQVYVHCTAGKQRSPAIVAGYLAWPGHRGLEWAMKRVTTARDCDPPWSVLKAISA